MGQLRAYSRTRCKFLCYCNLKRLTVPPMTESALAAPEWITTEWLNVPAPLSLEKLKGRVILAGAFQMLCPGCVSDLIPQLRKAHQLFKTEGLAVIGLHTVFEHHAAMEPVSLKAFLHENRVSFPVAIDKPNTPDHPIPATMQLYGMQGTPTMMLIDRNGNLRRMSFGHIDDMQLGAEVMTLLGE
jgi:peroxiredoxin